MSTSKHDLETNPAVLSEAANEALRAPSVFNTQPWTWRIHDGVADLRLDRSRQLAVVDPEARLATISCGAALHHFRAALAATGHQADVARLPDPSDRDLLARIRTTGAGTPTPVAIRHYESLLIRHTDRRPFSATPLSEDTLAALRAATEAAGAHLHLIRPDQFAALIVAAGRAAAAETGDPAYRAEVNTWTSRPDSNGDGVPRDTAVPPVPRRVPVRDFALGGDAGLPAGPDADRGTSYAVIFTGADDARSWLQAGEALGALLVTAVEHDAAVSPMSDLIEVPETRQTLRRILSGVGEPMLVLRIGHTEATTGVPATPRRAAEETIEGPDTGAES